MTATFPFDVNVAVGESGHRHWTGTLTWTRDLTTQIVEMAFEGTLVEGTDDFGLYVYWGPGFTIPVEMRPEAPQYPYLPGSGVTPAVETNGQDGYLYIGNNNATVDGSFRYITAAPIQADDPEPTDSLLADLNAKIAPLGVGVWPGYAPTGAGLPYVVTRPLDVGLDTEVAVAGNAFDWNTQISAYCCAESVEASFNLALAVVQTLQGSRLRGTTLSATIGYNGAQVEGHYESQVTVQLNQGGF